MKIIKYIFHILLLAAIYVIAGKLGLLLAIPPGYASALFPAAGIALGAVILQGYRILPGVFLGSLLLNISISYTASDNITLHSLIPPIPIAFGAMLQAYTGTYLLKKLIRFPVILIHDKDILLFIFVGAFVSCLISPSIGVTSLYLSDSISSAEFMFNWWNWWVGDTLGVLLAMPLVLIFWGKPRYVWKSRIVNVAFPLSITCALVIYIFITVSNTDLNRLRNQFNQQSVQVTEAIQFRTHVYIKELISLERFFTASNTVGRNEFRTFVSITLKNNPSIQALEWLPRVEHARRKEFEESIRQQGFPKFQITERNLNHEIVPSIKRNFYYPVTYVEPVISNEKAFGFDVASNITRRKALERAAKTGRATMTGRINLIQDKNKQSGALIFYPVYEKNPEHHNINKAKLVSGFVLGVFRITDLIESAVESFPQQNYNLRIIDITDITNTTIFGDDNSAISHPDANIVAIHKVTIAGRNFLFEFYPTNYFFDSNRSWQAWLILAVGLFFAGLLGAYLLSITGRAQKTEHLVNQRTNELSSILDNTVEAILSFTPEGIIQSANPAAHTLFGYEAGKLIASKIQDIVPDSMSTLYIAHNSGQSLEMRGCRKDGTEFPIQFGISKITLADHVLYTCLIHDLTARAKIDRLKNEFISTVSHELRTPVTAIRGSLGLINEGVVGELPEELKNLLRISLKNSERLVNLVNDILNIEKLEFSSLDFNYAEHNISSLISESIEQIRDYAAQYSVSLHYLQERSLNDDLIAVTDKDRFYQIMSNLISNAVKFSNPGDRVEIDSVAIENQIKISVRDFGPGIPEDFKPELFKKFSQADSSDSRKRGGTGLGLSIVKTMVTKMSGSLYYESVKDQGTTFYFTLPRKLKT